MQDEQYLQARNRSRSNYELFKRSNFHIRYWSWNCRSCRLQICPPIDPFKDHSNCGASKESRIVIFRHYLAVLAFG